MYDIVEVSPVSLEVYCNCDQPDVNYWWFASKIKIVTIQ